MDFLKMSELYHTQMKGRKHDGVWQFQDKETGNFNDAGFIRYYGHPRGVRGDTPISTALATVNAGPGVTIDMDTLFTGSSGSNSSGGSYTTSTKAGPPPKSETKTVLESTSSTVDPRLEKIKEWKTQEMYEKYRKMYEPTNREQIQKGLSDMSKGFNEAANSPLLRGSDKRIYGKYPKMTDQELRERINRLSAERTYSDLVGDTKVIKSGQDKTREILQTLGGIAGLAVAGVTIYGALKGKGG